MIVFIPQRHGLGHFCRLANIANSVRNKESGEEIFFFLEEDIINGGLTFDRCNKDELRKAKKIIIDTNDKHFLNKVLNGVDNDRIIWITDLSNGIDADYYKIIAPFSKVKRGNICAGLEYFVVTDLGCSKNMKSVNVVSNIGIYFGSLDETNNLFFTLHKLERLGLLNKYNFNVLIGRNYPYKEFIDEYFERKCPKTINFYESTFESIYEYLLINDVLISCCNNSTFEALSVGIPVINIVQNRIQYENASYLEMEYGMPNLGFYPNDGKIKMVFTGEFFRNISKYSSIAKTIIDGKALQRISKIIMGE